MASEWLYEAGIGENRALKIVGGQAVAARIERAGDVRVGDVEPAVVEQRSRDGRRAVFRLASGGEALLFNAPAHLAVGQRHLVLITREAIGERGHQKRARAELADEAEPVRGPSLLDRISADGVPVRTCHAHDSDQLEAHGWSEIMAAARGEPWEFDGGSLSITPTSAMTVIDIDGDGDPVKLARSAAAEVGRAVALFDLQGNIGVDFPTIAGKADRVELGEIFDAHMDRQCERTAVNGFGFMQIVTRRERASLCERVAADPVTAAALQLLHTAERYTGTAPFLDLVAHPALSQALSDDRLAELSLRTGKRCRFLGDYDVNIWAGSVLGTQQ